ncbi:MAG TPA: plastocyanin/azurin family copper-binding protein [Longimicrobiales bacterium]|nr:plastocyanin/azurin family copper-binding protein [Longimicrobiales bacterium]
MQRRYAWMLAGVALLAGVASCSDGGGGGTTEPQTGTVSGSVEAAGTGVPGATLTLVRAQSTRTATSSGTGAFSFASVATGSWTLGIDPPEGFVLAPNQDETVAVTVNANQTTTVEFALEEEEPGDEPVLITLQGTSFSPSDVTISVGETVRWENRDGATHTVTPDGHSAWAEAVLDANGEAFEHTFNTAGTYNYYCNPHRTQGMTGVIRVQ